MIYTKCRRIFGRQTLKHTAMKTFIKDNLLEIETVHSTTEDHPIKLSVSIKNAIIGEKFYASFTTNQKGDSDKAAEWLAKTMKEAEEHQQTLLDALCPNRYRTIKIFIGLKIIQTLKQIKSWKTSLN